MKIRRSETMVRDLQKIFSFPLPRKDLDATSTAMQNFRYAFRNSASLPLGSRRAASALHVAWTSTTNALAYERLLRLYGTALVEPVGGVSYI